MQARRSGPVLSEQNFCASSRQAAIPPPPPAGGAPFCARATLAPIAKIATVSIVVLIVILRFLVVVAPQRHKFRLLGTVLALLPSQATRRVGPESRHFRWK